jgi:hypothetical protein
MIEAKMSITAVDVIELHDCFCRNELLTYEARPAQATFRHRLQDPPTRLPTQRCLTRH